MALAEYILLIKQASKQASGQTKTGISKLRGDQTRDIIDNKHLPTLFPCPALTLIPL